MEIILYYTFRQSFKKIGLIRVKKVAIKLQLIRELRIQAFQNKTKVKTPKLNTRQTFLPICPKIKFNFKDIEVFMSKFSPKKNLSVVFKTEIHDFGLI